VPPPAIDGCLVRLLVQRKWVRMVARLNREALEDSRSEEFVFGAERIPLDPVRQPLRELQNNRLENRNPEQDQ